MPNQLETEIALLKVAIIHQELRRYDYGAISSSNKALY